MYYLIKIVVTTVLIIAISEIAKRSSAIGALLASLPIISLIAIIWLYVETKDVDKVNALTASIFWLVLPSLVLFVTLPILLRQGLDFYLSIAISAGLTAIAYYFLFVLLNQYGVKL